MSCRCGTNSCALWLGGQRAVVQRQVPCARGPDLNGEREAAAPLGRSERAGSVGEVDGVVPSTGAQLLRRRCPGRGSDERSEERRVGKEGGARERREKAHKE